MVMTCVSVYAECSGLAVMYETSTVSSRQAICCIRGGSS